MATTDLDPYAIVDHRGVRIDVATRAALLEAEAILGYQLTVTQGIGTSVGASAGTHAEGRVVDLTEWDHRRKVRVLRDVGFAAWWRPEIKGLWPGHIHAVLILNTAQNARGIAAAAFRQIAAFLARRDGLASNAHDPTYRPNPPAVFHYPPRKEPRPVPTNNVTEARDAIVEAIHALGVAANRLDSVPKRRTVARAGAAVVRSSRRPLRALLRTLPKS